MMILMALMILWVLICFSLRFSLENNDDEVATGIECWD